jgi:hypothetical protein
MHREVGAFENIVSLSNSQVCVATTFTERRGLYAILYPRFAAQLCPQIAGMHLRATWVSAFCRERVCVLRDLVDGVIDGVSDELIDDGCAKRLFVLENSCVHRGRVAAGMLV